MSDEVCGCSECVLAGCDRPPVILAANKFLPQRVLHGRELAQFYAEKDARKSWAERLASDMLARVRVVPDEEL